MPHTLLILLCLYIAHAAALTLRVPEQVVQGQQTTITWTRNILDPGQFSLRVDGPGTSFIAAKVQTNNGGTIPIIFEKTGQFVLTAINSNFQFITLAHSNSFTVVAPPPPAPPPAPQPVTPSPSPNPAPTNPAPVNSTPAKVQSDPAGPDANIPSDQTSQAKVGPSAQAAASISTTPVGAIDVPASSSDIINQTLIGSPQAIATSQSTYDDNRPTSTLPLPIVSAPDPSLSDASTSAGTSASSASASSNVRTALIIGLVFGAIILTLVLMALLIYLRRRRERRRSRLVFNGDMMVRRTAYGGVTTPNSITALTLPLGPSTTNGNDIYRSPVLPVSTTRLSSGYADPEKFEDDVYGGMRKSHLEDERSSISSIVARPWPGVTQ